MKITELARPRTWKADSGRSVNSAHLVTFGVAAWLAACGTAVAEVRVSVHDGLVSVIARDATVRQILTEWARVGQAQVVNGERIPGGPISLELNNVPEDQALDLLLRSVSGYIAAPRAAMAANLSRYDRVIVMPASATPRPAATSSPPGAAQPVQQPPFVQPAAPGVTPGVPEDDIEEPRPQPNFAGSTNPRAPVFQTFPQPQGVNPAQPPPTGGVPFQPPQNQQRPATAPAPYPTAPYGGVAVPGMVAPPPPQPNQPGFPMAPGAAPGTVMPGQAPNQQPPRRPGG